MARLFLLCFLLVVAAVEARHAVSPLEAYWLSVLPNSTMPNAIHNLIDPVMKDSTVAKDRVKVRDGLAWCIYRLSDVLPSEDYSRSMYFRMKDMYPGAQMNEGLNFDQTIIGGAFVPRTEANRIKFCFENLPQILDHFSMVPGSKEANQIKKIIKDCEEPLIGEKTFCSTSLESMIDDVVALFGTMHIKALSSTIHRSNRTAQQGKALYTIASPIKKIPSHSRLVVCHQEPSPQAVHYCHTNKNIADEGFVVPLVGKDGSKVNAVAVCHHDSIIIDPFFFELLNVEPGVEPVCHFLPENHILWVSSEAMSKAVDICSDCVA